MSETVRFKARSVARQAVWAARDLLVRPTARFRPLPDYLILGAQRCGTTSLQSLLCNTPGVVPPTWRKGIHFFDTDYTKGVEWYRTHFPMARSRDGSITGEASPYYLFHPAVSSRIHEVVPDVKMIVLLRDPVERAVSHHKHEVRRGFESLGLEEAINVEPSRLAGEEETLVGDPTARSFNHQHYSYVSRGRYAEQLERYLRLFPRESLLVLESECFWEEPESAIGEVSAFLELDMEGLALPHKNATRSSDIPHALRERLNALFAESNSALLPLVGRPFRWAS